MLSPDCGLEHHFLGDTSAQKQDETWQKEVVSSLVTGQNTATHILDPESVDNGFEKLPFKRMHLYLK